MSAPPRPGMPEKPPPRSKTKPTRKLRNGDGSIDALPSGRYRWRLTTGLRADGRPISRSGTEDTRDAAQKAMIVAKSEHLRGVAVPPDQITVGEWLDRWLRRKQPTLALKTHHNYQQLIERHIKPRLGRRRLQRLHAVDLQALYDAMTDAGLRDTQRQTHNILHAALNEAVRLELVARNPATVVRPVLPRPDPDAMPAAKALTAEEVAHLLGALGSDRWGLIFEFMLHTGLRRGEVCGLQWADVDLINRQLRFRKTLTTVGGVPHLGPPKSKSRARPLRLSAEAVDCLRRQQEMQALERAALSPGPVKGHPRDYTRQRVWQDSGHVFTALFGGPLHPDRLRQHLMRFIKMAGGKHITNHGLRHTYASLMLRRQVPVEVVSQKLGHARASFTLDAYRHVYEDEHDTWALDLSDLLRKPDDHD